MEVEADEREHLTQLKELVTATNLTQTEKFLPKVLDQKHSLTLETFLPSNPDIGGDLQFACLLYFRLISVSTQNRFHVKQRMR